MTVVAIIPALNEEAVIGDVVRGALPWVDQVIVVDNSSTDATSSVASAAGARVVFEPHPGYGAACMAGVRAAEGVDVLVFLDGDGSDPPDMIPVLLEVMRSDDVDLVLGRRAGAVEPGSILWHQQAGNWLMALDDPRPERRLRVARPAFVQGDQGARAALVVAGRHGARLDRRVPDQGGAASRADARGEDGLPTPRRRLEGERHAEGDGAGRLSHEPRHLPRLARASPGTAGRRLLLQAEALQNRTEHAFGFVRRLVEVCDHGLSGGGAAGAAPPVW